MFKPFRIILFSIALSAVAVSVNAQNKTQNNSYQFHVDLNKVADDKLTVELITPAFKEQEVSYNMPKMVPGTYAIYNFGRFISNFHAYDVNGNELSVKHDDVNTWKIGNATKLYKLNYTVEDSWDTKDTNKVVFEPAGTNFEEGKNFLLNTHGLFGYFENYKRAGFNINIEKPAGMYGSTPMVNQSLGDEDLFTVPSYMELVDSPIMYCKPDTTVLKIGGADILVSVYDKGNKVSAAAVAENVKAILGAATSYFGGTLPIKKYAFIIYLFKGNTLSGSSGALEHSYSSVYSLQSGKPEVIGQQVRDVAAHEFYHIVTPLSIHAEQIGDFDYMHPAMSEHLWLYEGVTEYTATYVQAKFGLLTMQQYLDVIKQKMSTSQSYYNDSLPFTKMSKGCLDIYEKEYGNVYQKGALIGLCLDIKLRGLSKGKYGLQNLINDLAKKYGKNKSFKDEDLFPEIIALTYPEIGEFLNSCVGGTKPLPFGDVLNEVGIDYTKEMTVKAFTIGTISLGYNGKHFIVAGIAKMDDFGKALGYQSGDEIIKFNKKKLKPRNAQNLISGFITGAKEGDVLKIKVLRTEKDGKKHKVTLAAPAKKADVTKRNIVKLNPSPSEKQLSIRKAWIGKAAE